MQVLSRCIILDDRKEYEPVFCCDTQEQQLTTVCLEHPDYCPDWVIQFTNDHYYLRAPNAIYHAKYCPWCGKKLEKKKRS